MQANIHHNTVNIKALMINICKNIDLKKKASFSEKLSSALDDLKILASVFEISVESMLLLSVLFEIQFKRNEMDADEIIRWAGMSTAEFIENNEHLDALVQKGYVRRKAGFRAISYVISPVVVQSILTNSKLVSPELKGLTNRQFYKILKSYFNEFDRDSIIFSDFSQKIKVLSDLNPDLNLPKLISAHSFSDLEALFMINLAAKGLDEEIPTEDLRVFSKTFEIEDVLNEQHPFMDLDREEDMESFMRSLQMRESALIKGNLVQEQKCGSFQSGRFFELTSYATDILYNQVERFFSSGNSPFFHEIRPEDIQPVELFYDPTTRIHLEEIREALGEQYGNIVRRQQAMGLKPKYSVLLQGGSGSGKTEWIKQLAKNSVGGKGRPLLIVNLSELRDSYFSESEKRTKRLFDDIKIRVRSCVEKNDYDSIPIVLLDESDSSLFSNRSKISGSSSTDNTITNITNIVLREMDDLYPGTIIFVTTNLAGHGFLDNAMSRRFNHRVEVDPPENEETRLAIYKSVFKNSLDLKTMAAFAYKYQVTGGNIINVYQRFINYYILRGVYPDSQKVESWIVSEQVGFKSCSIGFKSAN